MAAYTFVINLKDQATPNAKKLKESLSSLRDAMSVLSSKVLDGRAKILQFDQALLQERQAFAGIVQPTQADTAAHLQRIAALKNEKAAQALLNRELSVQKGQFSNQAMGIRKQLAEMGEGGLTDAIKAAFKGPISGQLTGLLSKISPVASGAARSIMGMGSAFTGMGIAATAAAAAIVAVGVAFAAAAIKGISLALEATEAKARLTTLFDAMGEGQTSGKQIMGLMDGLRDKLGMTREEMVPLTKEFMAMGLRSVPELKNALTAAASASALMGDEGGAAFKSMMGRIQEAKEASGGLLKMNVGKKNPFAAMGVDINDVAKQMHLTSSQLGQMLKDGTANADVFGKALQTAITEKGKGPLERMASSFGATFSRMKESMLDMFSDVDMTPFIDAFKSFAMLFDKNTASGQAMKMGITAALNAIMPVAKSLFRFFRNAILDTLIMGVRLIIWVKDLHKAFVSGDWVTAGKMIIKGLIDGLMSVTGLNMVNKAMAYIGDSAIATFKNVLGIHSPSVVFAKMGEQTSQGFTQGFKSESERAGPMGPTNIGKFIPPSFAPPQQSASRRNDISVTMNVTLTGTDPKMVAEHLTEESVALVFGRLALTQGL
jgi:hypothetical protein